MCWSAPWSSSSLTTSAWSSCAAMYSAVKPAYNTRRCIANRLSSVGLTYCTRLIKLFTPPTRTRQNCLVLSCPCRRCELNCRQEKTVLSCLDPVSNLQLFSLKYIEDYCRNRVETRQNCLVLSPVVFTPPIRTRQDKTVLSCPCRRCEQAITSYSVATVFF